MVKKKDMIKIDNEIYKKEAFIIEDYHPAIGRILVVEGIKFKILDDYQTSGVHKSGTYLKKFTDEDQKNIDEYNEAMDELSSKLVDKLDLKRMIKENLKNRPIQELKTGLFILKEQENGAKAEEEHIKGCYNYRIHLGQQTFEFLTGGAEEVFR